MISFCCQQCSREYKVDDKYAGRKARCKQCGTYNVVPGPKASQQKPALQDNISFSCDTCGQKLRVKSIHAGKRVKCSSCGQPCQIPNPNAKTKPAKPAQQVAEMVSFNCQMCSARIKAEKSKAGDVIECPNCQCFVEVPGKINKPAPAEEYALKDYQDQPVDEDHYMLPDTRPSILSSEPKPRKTIPPQWRMPAAFATSFALGMAVVGIWTLIAIATGFQWPIFIIPVGALAGVGLTLYSEKRSHLLGFAGVLMALTVIFIGKAMVVKFVGIPAAKNDASVMDERFEQLMVFKANSESAVCIASCMELRDKGQIPPELVWYIFAKFVNYKPGKHPGGIMKGHEPVFRLVLKSLDADLAEKRKEEINKGLQAVEEYKANLTSTQKGEIIQNHRAEIKKECSFAAAVDRMSFAWIFISYIGLFDIISLMVGLVIAFNLGSGRNGSFA